ncbi:hypothetical protein N865_19965 [Intrasporangium oryzae NRRL B-24470]|uniref:Helicase n=1 Tax=Intrasporangium oryzae NRRL B-24470 TaxID=1386089 RepID=W9G1P5_9MICO|nr:DEAD/DEAH box helicase [Intrasporangium oryzae]EWS99884.1 hypothetical protein N865_19965 [Intrasporangium oryzae NRRL B-24470]
MSMFHGNLHPHQAAGVAFLQGHPSALLADEPGLGKTVQAAAAIGAFWDEVTFSGSPRRVLYVTTASLVQQTLEELRRFLPDLRAAAAHSNRGEPDHGVPQVLVASHDFVHRYRDDILGHSPVLVVVDEASALKGGGVKFDAVRRVCRDADRVVVMTATPLETSPAELWHMVELAGLRVLGDLADFEETYCHTSFFPNGTSRVDGWRSGAHAARAMSLIRPYFLRRTADELGLPLPRREDVPLTFVPLTPQQRLEYDRAGNSRVPFTRHRKRQRAARHASDRSTTLFDTAARIAMREAAAGHKVVVYTEMLEDLDTLHLILERLGVRHVTIRGANALGERSEALSRFRTDPQVRILLGSKVLEYGLNLQIADTLVSVCVSYNPAREQQREGRLRRISSPHDSYRHFVVVPDTPQTRRQLTTLKRRANQARLALDSTEEPVPPISRPRIVPRLW